MKEKKICLSEVLKRGIIFLFAWRDTLGLYIGGIPFRAGEIFSLLYVVNLFKHPRLVGGKEIRIVFILGFNLLITVISTLIFINDVESNFAIKYIIRNIWILIVLMGFLISGTTYQEEDIKRVCLFIVLIQFGMGVISLVTKYQIEMGQLHYLELNSSNYEKIGGIGFMRWRGSCSEPGYLAPILPIATFYYMSNLCNKKKDNIESYVCLILLGVCTIFSFSSAVYFMQVFTVLFVIIKSQKGKINSKVLSIVFLIITILIITYNNPEIRTFVDNSIIRKIQTYFNYRNGYNKSYSGRDRAQHIINAWNLFTDGNAIQVLFGHGTGGYYKYSLNTTSVMLNDVSEAYNLYLSTLTDRGILGLICLVSVIVFSRKIVVKHDIASETIWWGIFMQAIHWMIVGNNWLYYFWFEIIMLIGIYKGKRCKMCDA